MKRDSTRRWRKRHNRIPSREEADSVLVFVADKMAKLDPVERVHAELSRKHWMDGPKPEVFKT